MIKLTPHECKELQMKNPRLWWPNGYGEQYLYKASLSLISPNKDTLDVKKCVSVSVSWNMNCLRMRITLLWCG